MRSKQGFCIDCGGEVHINKRRWSGGTWQHRGTRPNHRVRGVVDVNDEVIYG